MPRARATVAAETAPSAKAAGASALSAPTEAMVESTARRSAGASADICTLQGGGGVGIRGGESEGAPGAGRASGEIVASAAGAATARPGSAKRRIPEPRRRSSRALPAAGGSRARAFSPRAATNPAREVTADGAKAEAEATSSARATVFIIV